MAQGKVAYNVEKEWDPGPETGVRSNEWCFVSKSESLRIYIEEKSLLASRKI